MRRAESGALVCSSKNGFGRPSRASKSREFLRRGGHVERQVHNEWISDDDRERLEALHAAACQGAFNNRHIEF
jgi:hypothetical protein